MLVQVDPLYHNLLDGDLYRQKGLVGCVLVPVLHPIPRLLQHWQIRGEEGLNVSV